MAICCHMQRQCSILRTENFCFHWNINQGRRGGEAQTNCYLARIPALVRYLMLLSKISHFFLNVHLWILVGTYLFKSVLLGFRLISIFHLFLDDVSKCPEGFIWCRPGEGNPSFKLTFLKIQSIIFRNMSYATPDWHICFTKFQPFPIWYIQKVLGLQFPLLTGKAKLVPILLFRLAVTCELPSSVHWCWEPGIVCMQSI